MPKQTQENAKVMPAGLPMVAAGAVWFVLAMILPVYKLLPLLICAVAAIAVFALLSGKRKAQIAKLPPAPTVKVRAQEIAKKLDVYRDKLQEQEEAIADAGVRRSIHSMATTLDLIADEVERDPADRNKVRKLANHYGDMNTGLVDKYIQLEGQTQAGAEGTTIASAMEEIRKGLAGADDTLKKLLDDLFSNDAMDVNADINVLEQLLKMDSAESKMDFSSLNL